MPSVDVHALTLAGAFVLGAVTAAVAVLRVVKVVTALFERQYWRLRARESDETDPGGMTGADDQ